LTAATPARFAKSDVDDHQVWEPIRSGGYGIGDIALHGADRVTDTLERFSKQSADHCIVFYDQGVQRLHRITSPPAPPSFTQTATLSSDLNTTASDLDPRAT
jgi:hypothetical protein